MLISEDFRSGSGIPPLLLFAITAGAFLLANTGQGAEETLPREAERGGIPLPIGPAALQPAEKGALAARLLPDGRAQLENEYLRATFDPRDMGAADSLLYKPTDKQLAVSQTYNEKFYKAFQEFLQVKRQPGGDTGVIYPLIRLGIEKDAAYAAFTGCPYVAPAKSTPEQEAYSKVRIVKTYRLTAGSSRLEIEVRAINESAQALPISLWLHSGMRVDKEGVNNFTPGPQGTLMMDDPWTKDSSTGAVLPRASGPWNAIVGWDAAKTGFYLASTPDMVEAVDNYLIKFIGFELQMGTPLFDLAPGKELTWRYACVAMQGASRVDAASPGLACGIEWTSKDLKARTPLEGSVEVIAPKGTEAQVSLRLRQLPAPPGDEKEIASATLQLAAGKAAAAPFKVELPDNDAVYVLAAVVKTADGSELRAERPLTLGMSAEQYTAPLPPLAGKPYWAIEMGEKPLPAWTQTCDRTVKLPMVPWNAPAAGRPIKVLFVGELNWTTGIFRDLARRAGVEWDFVNLHGKQGANAGDYRETEQKIVFDKIEQMRPDCILTAGLRYSALPADFVTRLLVRVRDGAGLVIVNVPGGAQKVQEGPWPALFKRPDFIKQEVDLLGPLAKLFTTRIPPSVTGPTEVYSFGRGRVVHLVRAVDPGFRNSLLSRNRGSTALPDWEYCFADYVRAMRYAAGVAPVARILEVTLDSAALGLTCESDAARMVTVEYDVVSTDLAWGEQGRKVVNLAPGRQTVTIPTPPRPGSEYVVHAWLLDGKLTDSHRVSGDGEAFLYRDALEAPVIDFTAAAATVPSPVATQIAVEGEQEPVPTSVVVKPDGGKPVENVTVALEIRNGGADRVVWRGVAAGAPVVTFKDFAYTPVAPESRIIVEVRRGDQVLTRRLQRITARQVEAFAENDFAFVISGDGVGESWYATEIMKPWARDAGMAAFIGYGGGTWSFPWKRNAGDNTLSPAIVGEAELHQQLGKQLAGSFAAGAPYVSLSDEFRLSGEYDFAEPTLVMFRQYLQGLYGTVEALNAAWGTQYKAFSEVKPILLKEAQTHPDKPAAWLDFRLFMDGRVNRRYEVATEEAAKVSPLMRTGDSGMYEPGYMVGINYYKMCQASRYMISYGGIRDAWTRAFMPADAVVGTWMGYGSQRPAHPWQALFQGHQFLAWWAFISYPNLYLKSTVSISISPNRNFPEIAVQQREILRGLGRLFRHAKPLAPRAFVPYSQSSVYAGDVLGRSYTVASLAGTGLLDSLAVPYSFIADEQAEAGRLDAMRDGFLVLPGIDALSAKTARAYAAAWDRGCWLLADAEVALRDGHGTRLATGGLDEAFGVRQGRVAPASMEDMRMESFDWTAAVPADLRKIPGQMVKAVSGLQAEGGEVWAKFADGTPAIVARRSPAGSWAVYLNTRFEWFGRDLKKDRRPEDKPDELTPSATVTELARWLLSQARVRPPVDVTPWELRPVLFGAFADGRARYYGALIRAAQAPYDVTITLPEKAHTYDVRTGKYLGETAQFQDRWDPDALAKVYAQLPYKVTGVRASADAKLKQGGESLAITGEVQGSGPVTEFHVVHCDLIRPDGARPSYGQQNLSAPGGKFAVRIPLALNDPAGLWKVELADAASGARTTVEFTLASPPAR